MRFTTRTFLWVFLPFTLLLATNFWAMRSAVLTAVRDGLRSSVRQNQILLAGEHLRSERENNRVLKIVAENPALKAGIQLLLSEQGGRTEARRTVEDQLSEISGSLGFDFLLVTGIDGKPLAGIERKDDGFGPTDIGQLRPPARGYFLAGSKVYQVTSVPIDQGEESIGTMIVGEQFDLAKLPTPAILLRHGRVVAANVTGISFSALEPALASCGTTTDCEMELQGEKYLSLPLVGASDSAEDYVLRSLQSIDAASAPVQATLRGVFATAILTALLAALGIGLLCSRSIGRPLAQVIAHLRESGKTGELPVFPPAKNGVQEIRELTASFNQAASAIRLGREKLMNVYVEFIGSLANALDARDPYTAGHSRRVSEYSVEIAREMNVSPEELEIVRVGALLHDIGKLGISDAILRKPDRLTDEEVELIREHPVIGKHILEGVRGFERYLPVVELHHENWDGTGYPHGLKAEETPLTARIVKVADSYDAMTSDRPYRRGMSHEKALRILGDVVGTELDRNVFAAFRRVPEHPRQEVATEAALQNLATAVEADRGSAPVIQQETLP
jgi:putative nucleotidyltransferase with HDIG domain